MPPVRGFQVIPAIGVETTYGTEVVATQRLRYVSDDLNPQYAPIENAALLGIGTRGPNDQGPLSIAGTITTEWDYMLNELAMARFFGTHVAADVGPPPVPAYYRLDDSIDDKGFTLALDKKVSPWAYIGSKASQLVISGTPGNVMTCAWSLLPVNYTEASTINTAVILAALPAPDDPRVLFHHGCTGFWIGDLTDPLTVADNQKLNNFSLTINRNLLQYHANCLTPEQAVENDFQMIELSITLPLYEDNFYVTAFRNHTPLQGRFVWTRGALSKQINIPNMRVTNAPVPVSGAGLIPRTVTLSCYNNLANDNTHPLMDFDQAVRIYEA